MPLFSKHGLPNSVKHHMKKQPAPPNSCPTRTGASHPTELMKGHSVFFYRTALERAMIRP